MSARDQRYNQSEKGRARYARYRRNHQDEIRKRNAETNARRLIVSGMYLGMVGFTGKEREELLGKSRRAMRDARGL